MGEKTLKDEENKKNKFDLSYVLNVTSEHLMNPFNHPPNIINAAAGCRNWKNDKKRFIPSKTNDFSPGTNFSELSKGQRGVSENIKEIFRKGFQDRYKGIIYERPSPELFTEIVSKSWHFRYADSPTIIRLKIIEVLENGETSHMSEEQRNNLLGLAKDSTVTIDTFIYNCIYTAIMCDGNNNKALTESQSKELENSIFNDVAGFSEQEKEKSLYDIHKDGKG